MSDEQNEEINEIGIKLKNYNGQVLPGDVIRAPKGFPLGGKKLDKSLTLKVMKNSRQGTNMYRLSLKDMNSGKRYSVMNFKMDGEYDGKKLPQWSMVRKSKVNEKWSKKYKKSIDCSNPKGFSQKAHCAGKKKRQENVMNVSKEKLKEMILEEYCEVLSEKKDACYHKVKARYDVWPSAYASGALVKCRKVGAANWGNKSKKKESIEEYDVDNYQDYKDFTSYMKETYGTMKESQLEEAEYQGRKVKLGKPMQGDVKKFKVYVKNPKGNVVKVNFGQGGDAKGGTMRIRKSNPKARANFRARHNCDNPGPRHKARYWSCRKW